MGSVADYGPVEAAVFGFEEGGCAADGEETVDGGVG